jgi:hypothetical protein
MTTSSSPPEPSVTEPSPPASGNDASMNAAIWAVAGTAVVLSLAGIAAYGARAGLGVAIGGAIATANLWAFARIGQAFITRQGNTAPWAVIAAVKLVVLLGGVWLILRSGVVSGIALTIGYGALPIGVTLGSLFGPKPPETAPDAGTVNRRPGDVLKAKPAADGDEQKDSKPAR